MRSQKSYTRTGSLIQCAYSLLEAVQGAAPERMHLALGGLRENGVGEDPGSAEGQKAFQLKPAP